MALSSNAQQALLLIDRDIGNNPFGDKAADVDMVFNACVRHGVDYKAAIDELKAAGVVTADEFYIVRT